MITIQRVMGLVKLLVLLCILAVVVRLVNHTQWIDLAASQKRAEVEVTRLDARTQVGQLFTSSRPGLSGILMAFLGNNLPADGARLLFHLKSSPSDPVDLADQITQIWPTGQPMVEQVFDFPIQPDSMKRTYFFSIESDAPPGSLTMPGSANDTYPDGSLYRNGIIVDQDLAFWVVDQVSLPGLWQGFLHTSTRLAAMLGLLLFYTLLGGLILYAFTGVPREHPFVLLGLAVGAGLTYFPVIYFITNITQNMVTRWGLVLPVMLLIVVAFIRFRISPTKEDLIPLLGQLNRYDLAAGIIFIALILIRAIQTDGLSFPNGMDSFTHLKIILQIIETGSANLASGYHSGFHGNVAGLTVIGSRDLVENTLVFGQMLSVAMGLTFYALVKTISPKPGFALAALVLMVCLSLFPGYLLVWGRFPYLQGITLVFAAIAAFSQGGDSRVYWIIGAFLLVGTALSHYGSLVMSMVFIIIAFIYSIFKSPFTLSRHKARWWWVVFLAALLPAALVIGNKFMGMIANATIKEVVSQSLATAGQISTENMLGFSAHATGALVWGFGLAGAAMSYFLDRKLRYLSLGWILCTLAAAWLQTRIFGTLVFSEIDFIIAMSLPLSLMGGLVLDWLVESSVKPVNSPAQSALFPAGFRDTLSVISLVVCVSIGIAGLITQLDFVNPSVVLSGVEDRQAIAWIMDHLPEDAVFLINNIPSGETFVASDGGGWIETLTLRTTVFPNTPQEHANLLKYIKQQGVRYYYEGTGNSYHWNTKLVERLTLIYEQGGIKIYQIEQ